jgi:hypothetical protein
MKNQDGQNIGFLTEIIGNKEKYFSFTKDAINRLKLRQSFHHFLNQALIYT